MNRIIVRVLLALLVLAGAGLFVLPLRQDGGPLMRWNELKAPQLPDVQLPAIELPSFGNSSTRTGSREVTVYRWRNGTGSWEYGQVPPEGTAFETITVDPDANLLPALKSSDGNSSEAQPADVASKPEATAPGGYLEKAREAKRASEERNRRQQDAIER